MGDVTGPIPESMISDLESLKLTLAGLEAPDVDPLRARLLAAEIGAIRLHLKRLALDAEPFDPPAKLDD
jgi:hypothetical protein